MTNSTQVFGVAGILRMPPVDVVVSYVGADDALINAAVSAGARGITSAGTGGSGPAEAEAEDEALTRAASAVVVVPMRPSADGVHQRP
jgi:L-asparaginase